MTNFLDTEGVRGSNPLSPTMYFAAPHRSPFRGLRRGVSTGRTLFLGSTVEGLKVSERARERAPLVTAATTFRRGPPAPTRRLLLERGQKPPRKPNNRSALEVIPHRPSGGVGARFRG